MPDNQSEDNRNRRSKRASGASFVGRPVRVARAYEELADIIRERIVSGELAEGDRIPSEAALASEAQVSRSTVREALRTLEQAGLVARASPKVMVVRRSDGERANTEVQGALLRQNATFEHLHEALLVLEPELTRLAARRAGSQELAALADNLREQERSAGDAERWTQLDKDFHLAIAQMSGNPALVLAWVPISDLLQPLLRSFMTTPESMRRALDLHGRIFEELQVRDADAAALMARKHVNELRAAWDQVGLVELEVAATSEEDIAALVARHAATGK
jgi:GntR family transcriptional regulator, transcriptional repressor for pyruvate dehydrogenase complex